MQSVRVPRLAPPALPRPPLPRSCFHPSAQVLCQAGHYVKDDVCRAFLVLIANAPDLHGYAVRCMYRNLHAYQVRTWRVCEVCRFYMEGV